MTALEIYESVYIKRNNVNVAFIGFVFLIKLFSDILNVVKFLVFRVNQDVFPYYIDGNK